MIRSLLTWINWGLIAISLVLVSSTLFIKLADASEIRVTDPTQTKRALPKCSFSMEKAAYDAIGKAGCDLKFASPGLQLPDLRNHLSYYGKNGRPDAQLNQPVMHFSFAGNSTPIAMLPGEKLYLYYDRSKNPAQYVFSSNNTPTPLWIEARAEDREAIVQVRMKNEQGEILQEPAAHAEIRLAEKEPNRVVGRVWELGKWRVDGSLLARQKARWMGQDRFFERHGGEEYKHLLGKQRVDFTDEEENYSVFVGMNDSLVWENGKWRVVQPGDKTLELPLMVLKKVDERVMNFELWDIGGKNKVTLNLIKTNEPWMPQNVQDSFLFLGARTRSQYIFEVDDQRVLISPKDWLVQTKEGWIKLTTAQEIDDYVDRKLIGILFVFDGVTSKEGRQVLLGVMFSPSRTEMQEVEIPVQQGSAAASAVNVNYEDSSDDEASDEEDDDDE